MRRKTISHMSLATRLRVQGRPAVPDQRQAVTGRSHLVRPQPQPPLRLQEKAVAAPGLTVQGLPIMKPPYGQLTAIDLSKGEILWQVAHGETPEAIRNHPC